MDSLFLLLDRAPPVALHELTRTITTTSMANPPNANPHSSPHTALGRVASSIWDVSNLGTKLFRFIWPGNREQEEKCNLRDIPDLAGEIGVNIVCAGLASTWNRLCPSC